MNSPIVNSGFTCFADSSGTSGDTLKAFIFSLKNSEGLPLLKCFAENENKAIFKSSAYGPTFGEGQGLRIFGKYAKRSRAEKFRTLFQKKWESSIERSLWPAIL